MPSGKFKHCVQVRVRNYEVDWQGIVHNANYLLYFEVGRIEYLRNLGISLDFGSVRSTSRIVLARNEVDYRSSAMFDDLLNVHTRISYIRRTSFAFQSLIEESGTGRLIAENTAVHVWLDSTGEPTLVSSDFRQKVEAFEGIGVARLRS